MRLTLTFFRCVAFAFVFLGTQAHAQEDIIPSEQGDAQAWLRRIQTAAHALSYSGVFVYQQGSKVRTSRITHVAEGGNEFEKLEILDGKPREYIRSNDEIVYYIPETKTLLVEKQVTQDVFPAILAANPTDLSQYYKIRKGERGRVAGFDSRAILLEPRDRLRYGYRLWAEQASGLLLRAQTLNHDGDVVEQIAFTHVTIGNISRQSVQPTFTNTTGWRIENSITSQATVSGWKVSGMPPGFRKIRELKRLALESTQASATGAPAQPREVTQIVYSDGVAAISIFIEPGTQSRTEGSLQQGAMNIIGKRQGDFWLTIVGEVPAAALKQVASSIEFKSK
jgi:sigma-E factor negative regulatory protein RseB